MAEKKVFLTGVTSFTGAHVGYALKARGYHVIAALTGGRDRAETDPLVKERLALANPDLVIENAPFGSEAMLAAVRKYRPHIFINHGAAIKGYRDVSFDYLGSLGAALANVREVFETLATHDCKRFIHTGTIFEADEGTSNVGMSPSSDPLSMYGASKGMVWQALRYWSVYAKLPLSKIVIPNPIGELENPDRLVPLFVKLWKKGDSPVLRTPHLVRDYLPASWLANVYANEADLAEDGPWQDQLAPLRVRRPSGFVLPNAEFVRELTERLKKNGCALECGYRIDEQPTNEPPERFNGEHVPEVADSAAVDRFWTDYAAYLLR